MRYIAARTIGAVAALATAEPWLERITRRVEIRHAGGDEREIDL